MVDVDVMKKETENGIMLFPLEYSELKNNIGILKKELGKQGTIMFNENIALMNFENYPNIRIKVKQEKYFSKDDFSILGNEFTIIGKGKDVVKKPIEMFLEDIWDNRSKILIIVLLFCIFVNPYTAGVGLVVSISEKLVEIIGIYIGMIFVFIGFFYGDKERTIDVYKKGLGYQEFSTDRYIINLAILDLVIVLFGFVLGNIDCENVPNEILNSELVSFLIGYDIKYWSCFVMILLAVVILVIEFDALINYYLKNVRNKYFIDAFEDQIKK